MSDFLEILGALTLIVLGGIMLVHSLRGIMFKRFCRKLGLAPTQELYKEYIKAKKELEI